MYTFLFREAISNRRNQDEDAFINRDITLKYSDMLEESANRKLEESKLHKKAETLRKKSVLLDNKDMSMFWSHVLKKQSVQKRHISFKSTATAVLAKGMCMCI